VVEYFRVRQGLTNDITSTPTSSSIRICPVQTGPQGKLQTLMKTDPTIVASDIKELPPSPVRVMRVRKPS
jgi:hypothetical protein